MEFFIGMLLAGVPLGLMLWEISRDKGRVGLGAEAEPFRTLAKRIGISEAELAAIVTSDPVGFVDLWIKSSHLRLGEIFDELDSSGRARAKHGIPVDPQDFATGIHYAEAVNHFRMTLRRLHSLSEEVKSRRGGAYPTS